MKDEAYFEETCRKVIELRQQLTSDLSELGFSVLPSQANFVFARPEQGDAGEIAQALREQGVIVRYFNQPRVSEYLRITVGTAEQNQRLIEALKQRVSA